MSRLRLLPLIGALNACGDEGRVARDHSWVPAPAGGLGPVVARVGEVPIFAAEVEGLARRGAMTPVDALDALVRFNLLAERARAAGTEAVTLRGVKPVLVERFLAREFEPRVRPEELPQNDLRAVYDRMRKRWVHPRLVDVAVLSVYSDDAMKPEARQRHQRTAADLEAFLRRKPPGNEGELLAIAARAEWAARRVRSARLWQSDSEPFSRSVGAEVQKLQKPGQLTPLVRDEVGYHVAMYIAERPPKDVPFEAAQSEIRAQLYPSWREQQFLAFTKALLEAHDAELRLDGFRKSARP